MATLRVTILGCGSSGGVPRADGAWGACDPNEPKNRRTRCGLLLQRWAGGPGDANEATSVLIDTAPELREQLARAGAKRLDGLVYTHDHADQTHGIDDVRAFVLNQRRALPVYMDAKTRDSLTTRFRYSFFGAAAYPAILSVADELKVGVETAIDGPGGAITLTPLMQDHGTTHSLGFRFHDAAYSNDVVALPDATLDALKGLDLWIVDALRYRPHPTHAHLEQALAWIGRNRPKRAVLTNLHIDFDYDTLKAELPVSVEPAFDGWRADLTV
ncbi:MAG: MBL fold metallo-hydrolase [Hyphomonadaceae bacterium]